MEGVVGDDTAGASRGGSLTALCEAGGVGVESVSDAVLDWLAGVDGAGSTDRSRIDALAALERVSAGVEAAKARVTNAFAESQESLGASRRSIAAQVGLARRIGLSRAERLVAAHRTLVVDLPHTLAALTDGQTSASRAESVAERVSDLVPEQRRVVDAIVADDLPTLGDREVRDAVDAAASRLEPGLAETRHRLAATDRRVGVRPLRDGMALLSVLMTATDAASCHATLVAHARSVLAGDGGRHTEAPEDADERTEGQLMADAAVARLSGRAVDEQPPVEIQLVVSDTTLLGHGTEPGHVVGVGAVPATVARDFVRAGAHELVAGIGWARRPGPATSATDALALARRVGREARRVTVRRVHSSPDGRRPVAIDARRKILPPGTRADLADSWSGGPGRSETGPSPGLLEFRAWVATPPRAPELAPLTSPARLFIGPLRRFVQLRDPLCRAPWCGAPVRHVDHVTGWADGGATSAVNGEGCCVGHNQVKEQPGWAVRTTHDGLSASGPAHTTLWRSPTGHAWTSTAVSLLHRPGARPARSHTHPVDSPLETHLAARLHAA